MPLSHALGLAPIRAPPGVQEEMIAADPERFYRPPYVGHRGWIGLRVDIAPDRDEVANLLDEAYRQVAPRTLVRQLDATGSEDS